MGRFLSVDPVMGGTENDYVYPVNPISYTDFTGQWGWGDAWNAVTSTVNQAAEWVKENETALRSVYRQQQQWGAYLLPQGHVQHL